jgi:hypothetical protein
MHYLVFAFCPFNFCIRLLDQILANLLCVFIGHWLEETLQLCPIFRGKFIDDHPFLFQVRDDFDVLFPADFALVVSRFNTGVLKDLLLIGGKFLPEFFPAMTT